MAKTAPTEPLAVRIKRLDAILADAHEAIVGNPKADPPIPAIDHDPLLHEGPDKADDEEMSYCPSCHVVTNIQWMRANLAAMK